MPLEVAAGAEADPPVVAAFGEGGDLMTPQLTQRLRVDAKNLRHCGGGHPISFEHRCSGSILNRWRRIRASALQSRPADAEDCGVLFQLLNVRGLDIQAFEKSRPITATHEVQV